MDENPLRFSKATKWFKGKFEKSHDKYTAYFGEKKQLLELQELF